MTMVRKSPSFGPLSLMLGWLIVVVAFLCCPVLVDAETSFDCDPCIDRPSFAVQAIVHGTEADDFWKQIIASMQQSALDLRVSLNVQPLYQSYNATTMARDIRNVLSNKDAIPNALLVTIPDSTVAEAVSEVVEAGVPVFGLNTGYEYARDLGLLGFVAMDEELAGLRAGEFLLERLGTNVTKALFINHESGNVALDLRRRGFDQALGFSSQVFSVASPEFAEEAIGVFLEGCQWQMILLAGSQTVEATLLAIEENGCTDVVVGTFDTNEDVNVALAQDGGSLVLAVSQNQHLQGVVPVVLAAIISTTGKTFALSADNEHGVLLTGPELLTRDNLHSDTYETCVREAFPVCPNTMFDGNLTTCACTERQSLTIAGVLHGVTTDPFWDTVFAAAATAALDMGVNLLLERLEPQASIDVIFSKMAEQIESYCNEGVDGIFVTIPGDLVIPAVQSCLDLGIPVININAGAEAAAELGVVHHVGQLEYNAGYSAGMKLIEAGIQEGFCLSHEAGNSALAERCKGFADALAEKRVLYSGEHAVPADSDSAYVASVLKIVGKDRTWKNVGLLLLGLPQIAPALLVKAEKPDVLLGAFDVSDELYAALSDGAILFGIDQNPYLQGYFPIPLLTYKITSKQALQNRVIESGPAFVTTSPGSDQKTCEVNLFKTCEELTDNEEDPSETGTYDDDDNYTAIIATCAAIGATLLLLAAFFVFRGREGKASSVSSEDGAKVRADVDQEQPLEKAAETPAEQPVEPTSTAPAETSSPSNEKGD